MRKKVLEASRRVFCCRSLEILKGTVLFLKRTVLRECATALIKMTVHGWS